MVILRRVTFALLLALAPAVLLAQSADQEVVSVVDSPDPVSPGTNLTYTVTIRNNGPNAAVNGGLNMALANQILPSYTFSAPAGFTCGKSGNLATCNTPSFASGATVVITITAPIDPAIAQQPNGSFSSVFYPSGTTSDPNTGNDQKTSTTSTVSPDADLGITATDAPDPVAENGLVTYTINVGNAGPDAAANAAMNVVYNGGTFVFQSITVPAGWTCPSPTVGQPPAFTCNAATLAAGVTSTFSLVVKADPATLGNGPRSVPQNFTTSSNTRDPNHSNEVAAVTTQYQPATCNQSVTSSASPASVPVGANVTISGTLANTGPDAAANSTLIVPLDSRLLFQSITVPAGFTCTGPSVGASGIINCVNASYPVGSGSYSVVVKVNPSLASGPGGTFMGSVAVGSDTYDTNNTNNSDSYTIVYTTPKAELAATNVDTPDPVVTGGTITYTQTLTNNGPDAATGVTFTQNIPAGTTSASLVAPAGFSCTTPAVGASGAVNCSAASMANGATASFTLVVTVTATSGSITDTVIASASEYDGTPGNNSATASTSLVASGADLSITKSTTTTSAGTGSAVSYTITVTNNGPAAAASVVMTDTMPASLLFASISAPAGFSCTTPAVGASGTITCSGAALANAATATFTLGTTVAGSASGTVSNSASVSSASDPNGGNNGSGASSFTVAAAASADLAINKSTAATGTVQGGAISYTIVVTNNGPSAATTVTMTDVLVSSLRFASISAPAGFSCTTPAVGASGTITCSGASLANGAMATFTVGVTVSPSATGTITNTAGVSSATSDPNGGNGSATTAPLAVTAPAPAVPTLSQWALLLMGGLLAAVALARLR